ncbi:DNA polymerase catalytic subunit [Bovine alphaherpesvirus 2]|uniref:DNA polymerase n=1 Tax=Bovine alphaherpesvirus 2 TaxID=10295 RepID=A0ABX6WP17_9ALPH|nr:DNA polymerase catalytic subunit [Bovine alphaherpesvirus 2]QPO25163.1 DNA polymerase catalytic subunit [Bovine alphaherpesvirus 2]
MNSATSGRSQTRQAWLQTSASFFAPPSGAIGLGETSTAVRASFFNPHVAKHVRHADGRSARNQHTYVSDCREFRFIAPRSLDEDAPPEKRVGVHDGHIERAPRVYCDTGERGVLDVGGEDAWPTRIRVWAGRDLSSNDAEYDCSEAFHVYDIVETVEHAHAMRHQNLHVRCLEAITPAGTVVTLMGTTRAGRRIAVHVYGTTQYFYMNKAEVDAVLGCTSPRDLCEKMAAFMHEAQGWTFQGVSADYFTVDVLQRTDVYYYGTRPAWYYRVRVRSSRVMSYLCDNFHPNIKKYECGVDATTRFVLDNRGFVSFGWYRFKQAPGGMAPQLRNPTNFSTSSDLEVNCTAENLVVADDERGLPDYKLMCFDIECKSGGDELAFPVATNHDDLVIQISCLLYDVPSHRLDHVMLFSLGSCDIPESFSESLRNRGLPEPLVLEFDSEFEMLLAFFTFLKQYGPEFVTGYNIINFDWPFLITKLTDVYKVPLDGYGRANARGVFRVWDIGQNSFQKNNKIKINGVVNIDMYAIAREKVKLSSYKLNAVAEAVLDDRKKDLDYKDIPRYYASGPELRGVIGEYCIQDSLLVGRLFFKFLPHLELSAVARLAGIGLTRAIYDGQQIRVYTCLLRLAGEKGFILPDGRRQGAAIEAAAPDQPGDAADECLDGDVEEENDEKAERPVADAGSRPSGGRHVGYQGAKVLDPVAGFHVSPVVVFDFASLYPSIIQAHNLCFSTLALDAEAVGGLEAGRDYMEITVGGDTFYFVKAHVRESLLSILLRDWLAMRKQIRARIPSSAPEEAVLLDKQQAAIKVVCNSVYGFTGVQRGLLPCLPVAATVTTIGRDMLLATRDYVHSRWVSFDGLAMDFPEAAAIRGEGEYSMRIIYGDTDSVFVLCRGLNAEGLTALGDRMATHVSRALFLPPIKLECEKTFSKLLMIAKKKYIGVICGGGMLIKGVDLARKNNCMFINRTSRVLVDLLFNDDHVSRSAAALAERAPEEWLARPLPDGLAAFGRVLVDAHQYISDPQRNVRDFVFTAELSRHPDAYANKRIAHLTVYYKLLARREQVPSIKDRIPYVIVAQTADAEASAAQVSALRNAPQDEEKEESATRRRLLVSDLAEDPAYVMANGIPLNTDYYFSHLLRAASTTFKALFGNNTRVTESLLKRFIPEVWHHDPVTAARLSRAGFAVVGGGATEEETRQRLRTAFDTLA